MKLIYLMFSLGTLSFLLGACLQTQNSSSQDADQFEEQPTGNPAFLAARTVIANNCADCHGYHNQTEEELISTNFVIPGDPENSMIFYRIKNSSGSQGPKNMPQTGELTEAELQIIFDWIDGIQ